MSDAPVLTQEDGGVLTITFNRPQARNAVNQALAEGVAEALDRLDASDDLRIATIDAVEQLTRYLERIRLDPAKQECRGVLAAQQLKPQAVTLAEARGIRCVEVDLAVLRGDREPDLVLF